MANKEKTIESLQLFATAVYSYALGHEIHGRIFKSQGFTKLGQKFIDHANEERSWVSKFIDRIIELGGCPKHEVGMTVPIIPDIHEYIKSEYKVSEGGFVMLDEHMNYGLDLKTYDLYKEYHFEEEEDMAWSAEQLEIIDKIGMENYLMTQL